MLRSVASFTWRCSVQVGEHTLAGCCSVLGRCPKQPGDISVPMAGLCIEPRLAFLKRCLRKDHQRCRILDVSVWLIALVSYSPHVGKNKPVSTSVLSSPRFLFNSCQAMVWCLWESPQVGTPDVDLLVESNISLNPAFSWSHQRSLMELEAEEVGERFVLASLQKAASSFSPANRHFPQLRLVDCLYCLSGQLIKLHEMGKQLVFNCCVPYIAAWPCSGLSSTGLNSESALSWRFAGFG